MLRFRGVLHSSDLRFWGFLREFCGTEGLGLGFDLSSMKVQWMERGIEMGVLDLLDGVFTNWMISLVLKERVEGGVLFSRWI